MNSAYLADNNNVSIGPPHVDTSGVVPAPLIPDGGASRSIPVDADAPNVGVAQIGDAHDLPPSGGSVCAGGRSGGRRR